MLSKYIPVLAKEGIKHAVGGRGIRGGLLVLLGLGPTGDDDCYTFQMIMNICYDEDSIPTKTVSIEVLKELQKDTLHLLKEDITDRRLLYYKISHNDTSTKSHSNMLNIPQ